MVGARPESPRTPIVEHIHRRGPMRFGEFVELALYGPGGFFTRGGGAGRAGRDFLTSPEVGPLFGVCVARALDREWERQGRPDPFVVVEGGAGSGRLCREVLRAAPACAPALHYVLVERSPALRAQQAEHLPLEPLADILGPARPGPADDPAVPVGGLGPIVSALAELPARPVDGVVLANELLDNLPFEIAVREPDGWSEVRVGLDGADLVEIRVPASPDVLVWIGELDVAVGARLPVPTRAAEWIVAAAHGVRRGSLWLIDYAAPWLELAARDGGWLRTYADHRRAGGPLAAPGACDITVDVPLEMVERAARRAGLAVGTSTQAAWLRDLGIDDLVAEGAARWEAGAAAPDLEALAGRSRGMEAAALTDPRGLGAHTVFVLTTS